VYHGSFSKCRGYQHRTFYVDMGIYKAGENILIGVSGGGANLRNEKKGSILNVLQSIEFKSDDSPVNQ